MIIIESSINPPRKVRAGGAAQTSPWPAGGGGSESPPQFPQNRWWWSFVSSKIDMAACGCRSRGLWTGSPSPEKARRRLLLELPQPAPAATRLEPQMHLSCRDDPFGITDNLISGNGGKIPTRRGAVFASHARGSPLQDGLLVCTLHRVLVWISVRGLLFSERFDLSLGCCLTASIAGGPW